MVTMGVSGQFLSCDSWSSPEFWSSHDRHKKAMHKSPPCIRTGGLNEYHNHQPNFYQDCLLFNNVQISLEVMK